MAALIHFKASRGDVAPILSRGLPQPGGSAWCKHVGVFLSRAKGFSFLKSPNYVPGALFLIEPPSAYRVQPSDEAEGHAPLHLLLLMAQDSMSDFQWVLPPTPGRLLQ